MLAGAAAFTSLIAIWLRFSHDVAGPGGLAAFVEAAAGRRAALVQATVWTGSYALYLLYTGVYIVYDLLPIAVPGMTGARPTLAIVLPIAIGLLLVAGRLPLVAVIGLIAVAQVVLAVALDAVSVGHAATAPAFTAAAETGQATKASAAVGGLFICGSLPLFLGGDLRDPRRNFARILPAAFVVTVAVTLLAVYPYARHPSYTHAAIPGMTVVDNESSHWLAVAVGLGVAASVAGLMLIEGLALTRLVNAMTGLSPRRVAFGLTVALAIAAPISLIDPDRFYDELLRPSLILLWVAQLIVVLVFPRFVVRRGLSRARWLPVTAVAAATVGYSLWTSASGGGST